MKFLYIQAYTNYPNIPNTKGDLVKQLAFFYVLNQVLTIYFFAIYFNHRAIFFGETSQRKSKKIYR
jgi:hypothetical protein